MLSVRPRLFVGIAALVLLILVGYPVPGKGARMVASGTTSAGGSSTGSEPAGAPTLAYVNGGVLECTVGWQPVSNATAYTIYRSTSPTSGFSAIASAAPSAFSTDASSDPFYFDSTTLGGLSTYYYYVTATVAGAESAPSNTLGGLSVSDPNGTYTASGGDGEVSLATTSAGPVNIYRTTSTSGPWTLIVSNSNTGNWTDTAVTNGATKFYVFTNVNGTEAGGWCSHVLSATARYLSVPINIVPNPVLGFLPDPMTFPLWMEQDAPTDTPNAPGGDTDTASGGPSSVLSVNLAHGVVDIDGGPDLVANNPTGPDISFERRYRTAMAAGNLSSPGLPAGWTHNWDYRLVPTVANNWGPLQLVYPNGASEPLTPVLDENGNPTGTFQVPGGAPYIATGVPTSTLGLWTSITLQHNGLAAEIFAIPAGDTAYRLVQLVADNGAQVNFTYSGGLLAQIDNSTNDGPISMELTLSYSGGLLQSVTDVGTGNSRQYGYGSFGLTELSSVSSIGSGGTEWAYQYTNLNGQPYVSSVGTNDPQGNPATASITYDPTTGRAIGLTDAKGDSRSYAYNDNGQATVATTGPSGNPDTYTSDMDIAGRETGNVDAAGDTTTWVYDTVNPAQVDLITPPAGNPETVETDTHGNPTRINYPYGNYTVVAWAYPPSAPLGQVVSVQEFGQGGTHSKQPTSYTYYLPNSGGPSGYLATVTAPNGGVTTYTYTTLGSIAMVQGPTTYVTYSYGAAESLNEPIAVTDALGNATQLGYDAAGRLISSTDPLGTTTQVQYNAYDQVTNLSVPGRNIAFTLGPNGKTTIGATLNGTSIGSANFDTESGPHTSSDALGNTNTLTLDSQFSLASLKNGNQSMMHQFNLNPASRSLETIHGTGANNLTRTTVLGPSGNLVSETGSDQRTFSVASEQTDPNMPDTITGVDASNLTVLKRYTYDTFGRITGQGKSVNGIGSGGHSVIYDDEDNIIQDGSGTGTVYYTYNLDGTRATMTVLGALYTYSYDADRHITSIVCSIGNQVVAYVGYSYDADGRVIAMRTPANVVLYSYDALGQVTSLQNLTADGYPYPQGGQGSTVSDPYIADDPHTIFASFNNMTYDALGDRTGMQYIVRRSVPVNPDQSHGPVTLTSGTATWTYDAAGRVVNEEWTPGQGDADLYQPPSSDNYAYDAAGNLTMLRGNALNVDTASDQLLATQGSSVLDELSHDASGEMTTLDRDYALPYVPGFDFDEGTPNVAFDSFGDLLDITGMFTWENDAYDFTFYYDAQGRIAQYGVFGLFGNGQSEGNTCTYDGDTVVVLSGNFLGNQSAYTYYIYGPTGLALSFEPYWEDGIDSYSANIFGYIFDPSGDCLSEVRAGGSIFGMAPADYTNGSYVLNSEIGNPTHLYFTGDFYDAYGGPIYEFDGDRDIVRDQVRYKGQYGCYTFPNDPFYLCYCHHRWYDPQLGRWISPDPSGLDGGVNVYEFCNDNPVMFSDPSGLDVGYPGFLGSLIPVYGSGRISIEDFQTGHPWKGMGWGLLAITEFDPFEDVIEDGVKLGARGGSEALGKLGTREAAEAAERRTAMAAVRATGRAGEAAVRAKHFIGPTTRVATETSYRVLDGWNLARKMGHEIKNVKRLNLSKQLSEQIAGVNALGGRYTLWIRRGTELSGPLKELIKDGRVILRRIP